MVPRYPQTARYIEKISNVKIEVSRASTKLQQNDSMLVCKLKYRVANPNDKKYTELNDDDVEFWFVSYERTQTETSNTP